MPSDSSQSAPQRAARAREAARETAGEASSPAGTPPDAARSGLEDAQIVLDDAGIRRAMMRIAHEIYESHSRLDDVYLVAIPNGGLPLGRLLVRNLEQIAGERVPLGFLDTTLYRDDLTLRGERPRLRVTEMPSSVDDRVVILVEDVVNTGRTIRAAMDALMDFGRPRSVAVVALVDRGHRELPIKIDFVGKNIPTRRTDRVTLRFSESDVGPGEIGELEVLLFTAAAEEPDAAEASGGDA